jgi:uncharacterized membrane protein required for colicin V production
MEWLNSFTKFASSLTVGWVDFVAIIVICLGMMRGRKRGLSEEILDTTMWILILVAGGLLYRGLGDFMSQKPFLSRLTYYMISYIGIALGVKIVFALIKAKFGSKIAESDVFGRLEFYGGMGAGAVRFMCVFLFILALLNAPHYSAEFLAQRARDVDYNYGSDFFPHPSKIQTAVFAESFTGKNIQKHLPMLLIARTDDSSKGIRDDSSLGRRNERRIDAIVGGRGR